MTKCDTDDETREAVEGLAAQLTSTAQVTLLLNDSESHGPSRFHWNGSEIVICALGPVPWDGLVDAEVGVVFDSGFRVVGRAVSDRVAGVAPEFRAAAVRYRGAQAGNAECDALGSAVATHRLFITPLPAG